MHLVSLLNHYDIDLSQHLSERDPQEIEALDALFKAIPQRLQSRAVILALLNYDLAFDYEQKLQKLFQRLLAENSILLTQKDIVKITNLDNPHQLIDSLNQLLSDELLNNDSFQLLCNDTEPHLVAELLSLICTDVDVPLSEGLRFVKECLVREGLREAIDIFKKANIKITMQTLKQAMNLAELMHCPLLSCLYNERFRGASDYVETPDPIGQSEALAIIELAQNQRIDLMYNHLQQFVGMEPSLFRLEQSGPYPTIEEEAIRIMKAYFKQALKRANTAREYKNCDALISTVRRDGPDCIWDDIKDALAEAYVKNPNYSPLPVSYDALMMILKPVAHRVKARISLFVTARKASPGFIAYQSELTRESSFVLQGQRASQNQAPPTHTMTLRSHTRQTS